MSMPGIMRLGVAVCKTCRDILSAPEASGAYRNAFCTKVLRKVTGNVLSAGFPGREFDRKGRSHQEACCYLIMTKSSAYRFILFILFIDLQNRAVP